MLIQLLFIILMLALGGGIFISKFLFLVLLFLLVLFLVGDRFSADQMTRTCGPVGDVYPLALARVQQLLPASLRALDPPHRTPSDSSVTPLVVPLPAPLGLLGSIMLHASIWYWPRVLLCAGPCNFAP